MNVVGVDPSLTATGIACTCGLTTVKPGSVTGVERLVLLRSSVLGHVNHDSLVVIEGYSYASSRFSHQLGELGGVIRLALYRRAVPWVEVAPSRLKMFAVGKGNADKDEVFAAAVRIDPSVTNRDEADAWWLRQMGLLALDLPAQVDRPKYRNEVLERIAWPEMASA